jgi:hypothetical protein
MHLTEKELEEILEDVNIRSKKKDDLLVKFRQRQRVKRRRIGEIEVILRGFINDERNHLKHGH